MSEDAVPAARKSPYAVIELKINGKTFAAPACTSWRDGISSTWNKARDRDSYFAKVCYWPKDESRLSDLLLQRSKPKSDWHEVSNIRVFAFCSSLSKAKSKAELAQMTSDLSDENSKPGSKRKRQKPDYLNASLESSDTDDDAPLASKLKISSGRSRTVSRDRGSSGSESSYSPADSHKSPCTGSASNLSPPGQTAPTGTLSKSSPVARRALFGLPSNDMFGRSMMAAYGDLKKEVGDVHKLVYKIYLTLCNPVECEDNLERVPQLPLTSEEHFATFSTHCQIEEQKLSMVKYLSEFGGVTLRTSVFNMLSKLLTNELAMNYNVTGYNRANVQVEKKRFKETIPYSVIKAAVKLHSQVKKKMGDSTHPFNSEQFDNACSDWLKDAKKRHVTAESRRKKEEDRRRRQEDDEDI